MGCGEVKTPEEIKKGLECCAAEWAECEECTYCDGCVMRGGNENLDADALAYIKELENRVSQDDFAVRRWLRRTDEILRKQREMERTLEFANKKVLELIIERNDLVKRIEKAERERYAVERDLNRARGMEELRGI